MKRFLPIARLIVLSITAGLLVGGCGHVSIVKTVDHPEDEIFEDRMVTGSHIVYRVPKDTTIHPIHQPPQLSPLNNATVDIVDGGR